MHRASWSSNGNIDEKDGSQKEEMIISISLSEIAEIHTQVSRLHL